MDEMEMCLQNEMAFQDSIYNLDGMINFMYQLDQVSTSRELAGLPDFWGCS